REWNLDRGEARGGGIECDQRVRIRAGKDDEIFAESGCIELVDENRIEEISRAVHARRVFQVRTWRRPECEALARWIEAAQVTAGCPKPDHPVAAGIDPDRAASRRRQN